MSVAACTRVAAMVAVCVASVDGARADGSAVDAAADYALVHARYLAETIGPRPDSTGSSQLAAEYIESQLRGLGLAPRRMPVGLIVKPTIRVFGDLVRGGGLRSSTDDNVVVRFDGASGGPAIVFIAHYDTVAGSPGATDNAVAVGVLIALARELSQAPPARPVVLLFAAAEENGLLGARAFVRDNREPIGLAVSIDLFGFDDTITLNGLSEHIGRGHLHWLASLAREHRLSVEAPPVNRIVSRKLPQIERSDHGAFGEAGIPAIHLYNRGPDRIFLHYHQPTDGMWAVDRKAAAAAFVYTRAIARTTGALPNRTEDDGLWISTAFGPFVTSVWFVRGAAAAALFLLLFATFVAVKRARSRRKSQPPRRRGAGIAAVIVAYVVAAMAAIAVEIISRKTTGHRMPWVHAPALTLCAGALLIAACATLVIAALSRWFVVQPGSRYSLVAAWIVALVSGALFAIDLHEVAVVPGLSAALIAASTLIRSLRVRAVLAIIGVATLSYAIQPAMMREGVFHGFYPAGLPLLAVFAVVALPAALVVGGLLAELPRPGTRGKRIVVGAAIAAALVATALLTLPAPMCEPAAFDAYGLTCELAR